MKISKVTNKTQKIESAPKERIAKPGGFADAFDMANKNQSEQELYDMLKDIEKLGGRLSKTKTLGDAILYRNKIKEYLAYIIKNTYTLRMDNSPFSFGIHTRIEVINNKLDELTREVLSEQKENINIADKIEEIKGLLIDFRQ